MELGLRRSEELRMSHSREASELSAALEREVELLDTFVTRERELRRLVMDRNWPELEGVIETLNEAAGAVAEAEERRNAAFNALAAAAGLEGNVSFYDVVTHIPQDRREDLVRLFRDLKVAVMRVQGLNSGIESFVQARSRSLTDVLEAFGPRHRGKVYGRDGAQTRSGREALVVDTAR